jgi:hypothetical protein
MEWDSLAPTITTQCFGYGNGRFGHPEQDRAITLREAAILQTFPDSYRFLRPGEIAKYSVHGRLIGNAVPVRIGEIVAQTIAGTVERKNTMRTKLVKNTKPQPVQLSEEVIAKCDAPNQFENFDRMFRSVITVPKAALDKEEAKWKRKQAKKRADKAS